MKTDYDRKSHMHQRKVSRKKCYHSGFNIHEIILAASLYVCSKLKSTRILKMCISLQIIVKSFNSLKRFKSECFCPDRIKYPPPLSAHSEPSRCGTPGGLRPAEGSPKGAHRHVQSVRDHGHTRASSRSFIPTQAKYVLETVS